MVDVSRLAYGGPGGVPDFQNRWELYRSSSMIDVLVFRGSIY